MTSGVAKSSILAEIHSLARPLTTDRDLSGLVRRAADCRFVAIGEASHGTHEFYTWRDTLSRRLIEEEGYNWIGVEGGRPRVFMPCSPALNGGPRGCGPTRKLPRSLIGCAAGISAVR